MLRYFASQMLHHSLTSTVLCGFACLDSFAVHTTKRLISVPVWSTTFAHNSLAITSTLHHLLIPLSLLSATECLCRARSIPNSTWTDFIKIGNCEVEHREQSAFLWEAHPALWGLHRRFDCRPVNAVARSLPFNSARDIWSLGRKLDLMKWPADRALCACERNCDDCVSFNLLLWLIFVSICF